VSSACVQTFSGNAGQTDAIRDISASSHAATVRAVRVTVGLLRACHPAPALAVTVFAVVLAVALGADAGELALVALAVGSGQLSVGWSNDRIDAARDVAAERADKPVVTGDVTVRVLTGAAATALLVCVVSSLALGVAAGVVHLVAVGAAWAYNLRLKSTVLSFLPYLVAFGLLPAVVTLAVDDAWPPWWVLVTGAVLGVGAHVANTLPDLEDDERLGVRGLPHRLGRARAGVVAALVLLAGTVVVVLGPPGPPTVPALVAAALAAALAVSTVVVSVRAPTSRVPFLAAIGVAAVDVVLLAVAVARL